MVFALPAAKAPADERHQQHPDRRQPALREQHGGHRGHQQQLDDPGLGQGEERPGDHPGGAAPRGNGQRVGRWGHSGSSVLSVDSVVLSGAADSVPLPAAASSAAGSASALAAPTTGGVPRPASGSVPPVLVASGKPVAAAMDGAASLSGATGRPRRSPGAQVPCAAG